MNKIALGATKHEYDPYKTPTLKVGAKHISPN